MKPLLPREGLGRGGALVRRGTRIGICGDRVARHEINLGEGDWSFSWLLLLRPL